MITKRRPFSFFSAQSFLGKKDKKKLGCNTWLIKIDNDTIGIKYHNTFVIQYKLGGNVILNNGGWDTPTTKKRLNDFTNARVWQKNFNWYVTDSKGTHPFFNGMIVDNNGDVVV